MLFLIIGSLTLVKHDKYIKWVCKVQQFFRDGTDCNACTFFNVFIHVWSPCSILCHPYVIPRLKLLHKTFFDLFSSNDLFETNNHLLNFYHYLFIFTDSLGVTNKTNWQWYMFSFITEVSFKYMLISLMNNTKEGNFYYLIIEWWQIHRNNSPYGLWS